MANRRPVGRVRVVTVFRIVSGAEIRPGAKGRSRPYPRRMSQHPFANPLIRHGIGLSGAVVVALVAYLFLDGTTQLVAYGIAALDLLVTPQILKRAVVG